MSCGTFDTILRQGASFDCYVQRNFFYNRLPSDWTSNFRLISFGRNQFISSVN